MMKKAMYSAIILLSAFLVVHAAQSAKPSTEEIVVTMLEGTAQMKATGAKAGVSLKQGDRIAGDHEVTVGEKSRLELRFPDATVMRLSEKSRLNLSRISFNDKTQSKTFKVNLVIGKIWANVKKLMTPDSAVEIRTVNAVAGVRGTVYRVNVEEDTSATVKVYDGAVYVNSPPHEVSKPASAVSGPVPVSGPHEVPKPVHEVTMEEWHVIVKSMQEITISPQGVASQPKDFTPQEDADDWVRWNQEQDKKIEI